MSNRQSLRKDNGPCWVQICPNFVARHTPSLSLFGYSCVEILENFRVLSDQQLNTHPPMNVWFSQITCMGKIILSKSKIPHSKNTFVKLKGRAFTSWVQSLIKAILRKTTILLGAPVTKFRKLFCRLFVPGKSLLMSELSGRLQLS